MQVTTVHQYQALVRGRRKDLGLSQDRLARSAGVSRKWLSEFERGATTAVELPLVLRVLAALGPKVLRLAAERAAGAHPYLVPPEHTRQAREILGDGVLLAPENKVVLHPDDSGRI